MRAVRVTHEVWCQALRARTILASTGSAVPQVDMIISALWADKDEVQLALMQQVIATHSLGSSLISPDERFWYIGGDLVAWLRGLLTQGTLEAFWAVDEAIHEFVTGAAASLALPELISQWPEKIESSTCVVFRSPRFAGLFFRLLSPVSFTSVSFLLTGPNALSGVQIMAREEGKRILDLTIRAIRPIAACWENF